MSCRDAETRIGSHRYDLSASLRVNDHHRRQGLDLPELSPRSPDHPRLSSLSESLQWPSQLGGVRVSAGITRRTMLTVPPAERCWRGTSEPAYPYRCHSTFLEALLLSVLHHRECHFKSIFRFNGIIGDEGVRLRTHTGSRLPCPSEAP